MFTAHSIPTRGCWPPACPPQGWLPATGLLPGLQLISDTLHLPFDVARTQHAEAVHAGLLANSMLASRDFEHALDALEHMTLGPFARSV